MKIRAFIKTSLDERPKNVARWLEMVDFQKPPAGAGTAMTVVPLMIEKTGDMFILASNAAPCCDGERLGDPYLPVNRTS